MSEKTKQRLAKISGWCVHESHDFFTNLMRDMKSVRALWNYLFLALYTWVCCYLVLYHADACGTSVVYTTGGIVTAVFTNYVWSGLAEKKASGQFPPYAAPAAIPKVGDKMGPEDGNG